MLKRPASANPHQEVRQVLQGRTEPSVDDVPKLQFVEQCFREALRLYSPVTFITRDVAHDTLLGGHRVYQGERINLVTRALHTNPEYWAGAAGEFGDPLSFNPDRFSPEAVRERHPNAYHPWGFASRACIGSQFALFEAKTFLASMLIHFRLQGIRGTRSWPVARVGVLHLPRRTWPSMSSPGQVDHCGLMASWDHWPWTKARRMRTITEIYGIYGFGCCTGLHESMSM